MLVACSSAVSILPLFLFLTAVVLAKIVAKRVSHK